MTKAMAKTDGSDLMKKVNDKKDDKPKTLKDWIQDKRPEIAQALPKNWDVGRMEATLISALRANPNLAKCTPISFICAIMTAAQMGLKPNTPLGQCYIIPYWNSKIKRFEAQFQIGYKGILEMGYRTDVITEIYADKIKKGDYLDYQKGTEKYIHHREYPEKWEYDKKGELIITHYYAIYKTIKGGMNFSIWPKDMVVKHMKRYSPAARKDAYSPWQTSDDLMSQKTVLKDVMRYAPIAEDDRRILAADETVKREISKDMLNVPAVYEFSPDDLKGMDDVKFEGEEVPPAEEKGTEKPGKEKSKKKGKAKGIRPEPGEDKTGQPEENRADQEEPGGQKLDTRPITEKQMKSLFAMGKELGYEGKQIEFKDKVKAKFKLGHLKEMARFQYDQIREELTKRIKTKKEAAEVEKEFEESEQGEML